MSKKITPKQKDFADNILNGDNKTQAALKAYDTESKDVAKRLGSLTYKKDNVQDYIKGEAFAAAERVTKIAKSAQNESVKLKANQDILDRAGYKPKDDVIPPGAPVGNMDQQEYLLAIAEALKAGDSVALERIVLNPQS